MCSVKKENEKTDTFLLIYFLHKANDIAVSNMVASNFN